MTKVYDLSPPEALAPTLSLTEMEVHLIKGLKAGTLKEDQQQTVYSLIVGKICRLYGPSFAGEDTHASSRNEGMRLIGIYLEHLAQTPFDKL